MLTNTMLAGQEEAFVSKKVTGTLAKAEKESVICHNGD